MYARDQALIATPVGPIRITGDESRITAVHIGDEGPLSRASAVAVRDAVEQLELWFAGERQSFDLPLAPTGTDRGETLRQGLIEVPYGDTLSYGELAQRLGSSARAIGQLCARNPFPIIVPCHRVLGAGGKLGFYSGGEGPRTKFWLLEHERRHARGTLL
ncbi:methylated-DNA--[protein]-cysteine S-methyltransferase [Sphingomonas sp. DT-207]|uniref:methylated-DNA--[protein]-cysteine S-methyltransferase n=1 Tax=Sphingomonas sp. DT-207 TaxID=3396167 RepID=UPI003F196229